jgi:hypothetical protein
MWWYQWDEGREFSPPGMEVDDVRFVQPVGFVWLSKPRYRVKAGSRKMAE